MNTQFTVEIGEQPAALARLAEHYSQPSSLQLLNNAAEIFKSASRVVISGMGTSLYSPYIGLREMQNCSSVEIEDAGELLHFGLPGFQGRELLVAVSQSGESAETRQLVDALKERVKILSIVNDESSFMSRNSDVVLPILAGEEASISNKTYSNTLAVVLLLGSSVLQADLEKEIASLQQVAGILEEDLEESQRKARLAAEFLQAPSTLHVVARGGDLVSARQLALIAKEGADIFTESLSAGLFRHGPIELAGAGHKVIYFAAGGNEPELTIGLAKETARLGSRVVVINDRELTELKGQLNILPVTLRTSQTLSRYFPIICAPFLEYFVHEVAAMHGKEAGVFHHAQKVTDRE
jgi:fructoselysine-6-P-deglycase FrlB-like protein